MGEESTGRWMTGTSLGEGIAVAMLLGALVVFAVAGTHHVVSRVKVLEAIDLSAGDKTQWMERWAVTGLWPTRAPPGGAGAVSVLAPRSSATRDDPHYVEQSQES